MGNIGIFCLCIVRIPESRIARELDGKCLGRCELDHLRQSFQGLAGRADDAEDKESNRLEVVARRADASSNNKSSKIGV
jgi:hypothetical protein